MNVLRIAGRSLRSYRRPLLVWTLSLAALGLLTVLFWPAVRDATGLEDLIASLPEALRALIGSDDLLSPEGFLNSRLNSIFPLLITVYAAFRVASETAGEEQAGGFELVLGAPVHRYELLLGKALAVGVAIVVLMTGTGLAMALGGVVVDLGVPVVRLLAATTALALLGLAFGAVTFAVAGVTGRRGVSLGVGAGLAVSLYVLYGFAPLVPALDGLRPLTPFDHAIGYDPLSNGLEGFGSLVLGAITVLGIAAGLVGFERRDVGV